MTFERMTAATACALPILLCAGCDDGVAPGTGGPGPDDLPEVQYFDRTVAEAMAENSADHEEAGDYTWDPAEATAITLGGDTIIVEGTGVSVDGTKATIDSAGTYLIGGALPDGRVIVDAGNEGIVRLVLGGVDIACASFSPLSVVSAEKTVIILEDGTQNRLTDGESYIFEVPGATEPDACLFSAGDLTISGGGSLEIAGNYRHGISGARGLVIRDAVAVVDAADDGIRGRDCLVVRGAAIAVDCGGDGLKSNNDSDPARGYIHIESGRLRIVCGSDAIQAETDALISGGEISLLTGGGSGTGGGESSAKGIKADVAAIMDGGSVSLDCADDGINSNSAAVINGGSLAISCDDDAIHADSTLGVNGGEIVIEKCVEGLESALLSIADGDIRIASSDDGINASKGDPNILYLIGGRIEIDAGDDGIDANGSIVMAGGSVIIHGAPVDTCGAIDYDLSFRITGGFLLGAGSDGMAQAPDGTSTQNSVLVRLGPMWAAGTLFNIQTSSGETLFTFAPLKPYGSIVFSSPRLLRGETYRIFYGGSSTGTPVDGLYGDGVYTPGTELARFTVTRAVTTVR
ncbi:MAG: carbohydrate-binding domain-containing protein [Candidatus Krumholzibacteria bacterium]|nr:carbohydrate-binding domain-containing protein [Candidatus Krumholzibacteria bacterium]